MLLLLRGVLCLGRIKLSIFTLHLLLNHASVAYANVVVGATGDLLAQVLQPLSRCSQLPHLLDLESFSLLAHILEENCKIGGNAIRTLQVLDIITLVKFLTQLLAHGLNTNHSIGEANVRLRSVLETDRTKDLEFFVLALRISLFLFLFDLNRLTGLCVSDTS